MVADAGGRDATFDLRAAFGATSPGADTDAVLLLLGSLRLGRLLESFLHERARRRNLDTSQLAALVTLLVRGRPHRDSPTNLGRILVQTSGGTTKTIRRLEAAGLVRRVADPTDRRASLVELTRPGVAVAQRTLDELTTDFSNAVRPLGPERRQAALDAVRLLLTSLEDATGAAPSR